MCQLIHRSGNQRNGTCYTNTECQDRGGSASDNCALGFGVCCTFQITSTNDQISQNCTYLQNPGFPSATTDATALSWTVNKCSDDVCFLRLDFETFTLQGAGATNAVDEGTCLDTFMVTVSLVCNAEFYNKQLLYRYRYIIYFLAFKSRPQQLKPSPPFVEKMQDITVRFFYNLLRVSWLISKIIAHAVYIDIGANSGDTATLAFTFQGTATNRMWDIKVTQVECSNPSS